MDLANIEEAMKYFCRVCTANTKPKRFKHEGSSIGIFKRVGLKSILEKYLHLQVNEVDPLPKIICKSCFDKLEAIELLRVIAKRSDSLLKELLQKKLKSQLKPPIAAQPTNSRAVNKCEEVVVNVSMSDPLTKDINKKLQIAQLKRESLGKAFSPSQISRNAVTSSPNIQAPLTVVHQMPKKRNPTPMFIDHIEKQQSQATNTTTVTLENPPLAVRYPAKKHCHNLNVNSPAPLRHMSEAPIIPQNVEIHPVITGNSNALGHGMPLGSIIKDEDLLKLILKALKWPYNNQTLDIQIQRLKDTNFNDVIVDPNLLQDTDLIQILGPLLAPIPAAAPHLQTYHITIPPDSLSIPPTTMSYKLPAETSVQIITVPPEENKPQNIQKPRQYPSHRQRTVVRKRPPSHALNSQKQSNMVIVVSDESDAESSKTTSAHEDIPNFEVQLDPAMYPGVGENSNSNETMLATLNRQREAMMRMHRSKRKQSLSKTKNVEMVDDIMIVDEGFQMDEPYPEVMLVKKPRRSHEMSPAVASTSQPKHIPMKTFSDKPMKKEVRRPAATVPSSTHQSFDSKPLKPANKVPFRLIKPKTEQSLPAAIPSTSRSFAKVTESTNLPPLKKIKLHPKASRVVSTEVAPMSNSFKKPTVADADSTTKTTIKEPPKVTGVNSKVGKEEVTMKLSKPATSSVPEKDVSKEKIAVDSSSDSDDEVVIVVEYEDEHNESPVEPVKTIKKSDQTNQNKKSEQNKAPPCPKNIKSDKNVVASFNSPSKEMDPLHIDEASFTKDHGNKTDDSSFGAEAPTTVQQKTTRKQSVVVTIPADEKKETKSIELEAIEIKEEDEPDVEIKQEDLETTDEEKDDDVDSLETTKRSQRKFVASKTAGKSNLGKQSRAISKRKIQPKEEAPEVTTITNFRPARKSKTLSKYYKGPPHSGTAGRSMRSRT